MEQLMDELHGKNLIITMDYSNAKSKAAVTVLSKEESHIRVLLTGEDLVDLKKKFEALAVPRNLKTFYYPAPRQITISTRNIVARWKCADVVTNMKRWPRRRYIEFLNQ